MASNVTFEYVLHTLHIPDRSRGIRQRVCLSRPFWRAHFAMIAEPETVDALIWGAGWLGGATRQNKGEDE
jgi:hypothetical protein